MALLNPIGYKQIFTTNREGKGLFTMLVCAGQKLGNYRLIRSVGQGGFAEVFLGEHIYLKTPAAIKVLNMQLDKGVFESFLAEAHTIASLEHPSIVRVLEFGIED